MGVCKRLGSEPVTYEPKTQIHSCETKIKDPFDVVRGDDIKRDPADIPNPFEVRG
jgi:hypothetical protein